jgi:hypothetical protein
MSPLTEKYQNIIETFFKAMPQVLSSAQTIF